MKVIESEQPTDELRKLCTKLLLRMGIASANGDLILRAALYQEKYQIDLTREIKFFCKQDEHFEKPFVQGNNDFYSNKMGNLTLGEPFKNQTHQHRSFCTDGKYWFMYSDEKGLRRADRKANEGISAYKSDTQQTLYPGFTMFCHNDMLLVRHQGAPDEPFVAFDKETLKPVEGQEPFKFADSDEVTLKWTP